MRAYSLGRVAIDFMFRVLYDINAMKNILFTQKVKKYQGKYIAVVKDKVVASGRDAKEAFQLGKKVLGEKKIEGIYYIPQKKDFLTALCVFHISN